MDTKTMFSILITAQNKAIAELPSASTSMVNAQDYKVGMELAAQLAAGNVFSALYADRSLLERLKDVVEEYKKQYGDMNSQSLKEDLISLGVLGRG